MSAPAGSRRLYTIEEALALDLGDKGWELIEGEVVEMSPTGRSHGRICSRLIALLSELLACRDEWEVISGEAGFVLGDGEKTLVAPDVAIVRRDQPLADGSDFIAGAPTVAIEVLSPANTRKQMMQKVLLYQEHGAGQVWLVDPASQTIMVQTEAIIGIVYKRGQGILGEGPLGGFEISVDRIFED